MNKNDDYDDMLLAVGNIFDYIFKVFTHLMSLTIYESSCRSPARLIFNDSLPFHIYSSTILILNIKVQCFDDCLYLLDGRFNQLHTLYVDLVNTYSPQNIKNQVSFARNNSIIK